MLVEVKSVASNLGDEQYNQLYRYFAATEARVAVLTNGVEAWFFSDTNTQNIMDRNPFFIFNIQNQDTAHVEELTTFHKDRFDTDSILSTASTLKYRRDATTFFKRQFNKPGEDFTRHVAKQIHEGPITKAVVEQVRPAIQSAMDQIIRDRIEEKLGVSFQGKSVNQPETVAEMPADNDNGIITAEEEREAFMIVRAIAARTTAVERITMRDAKSYCAILADDNNRKPICRLYFNSPTTKWIGLFDGNKAETRVKVDGPECLYEFQDQILDAIQRHLGLPDAESTI